jgi:hypothetical protein
MAESDRREFSLGPLRVIVDYRRTDVDEGPSIRVLGTEAGQLRQVLRFDCFVEDPHYHYDPDGCDELHHMLDEGIAEPIEWTVQCLERNLPEMIRRAGFGTLADQVKRSSLEQHLAVIREAMMAPAV